MSPSEIDAAREALEKLAGEIARLESTAEGWDPHYAGTLAAIKSAIEALNAEAFRRLISFLREDPAAAARLNAAVRDPFVFGVLRFHGLVKDPLEHRVEQALEEVRPLIREHGGDVELAAVNMPDTVEVRMTGACHGCPASSQTLTEGVERAIRSHCPEVLHVRQVSGPPPSATQVVHFVSPFAKSDEEGWERLCLLAGIPDGGIAAIDHRGHDLLVYRRGSHVSCMTNACTHRGVRMHFGRVHEGVIMCPYHDWSFDLKTGECLTVPQDTLEKHPVRVRDGYVTVRLAR